MNKISFNQAKQILEACAAVIWGNGFLSNPYFCSDEIIFYHTDEGGMYYRAAVCESDNEEVKITSNSIVFINNEGEEEIITPLIVGNPLEILNK